MLEGKVGVVTGASKGIGLSITENLLKNGAIVYAVSRTIGSLDSLKSVYNDNLVVFLQDVTDSLATKKLFKTIKSDNESLDFLINNAGVVSYEFISMVNARDFNNMFQINVTSVLEYTQLAFRIMGRRKKGSIVNISSLVATRGSAGQASYSATKGAINSFTMSAAKEFASSNVRVNALAPGMVGTERFRTVLKDKFERKTDDIGFGRLAEPEEIANACIFLIGDSSQYITGQIIEMDGATKI